MRWTEEQLALYQDKQAAARGNVRRPSSVVARTPVAPAGPGAPRSGKKFYALGRLAPGAMNKLEAAYAEYLRDLVHAGDVLWFKFEGVKLRLADNTFLTVDFAVMTKDGILEMKEIKGWMQEDANVKLKVAASIYPFKFTLVRARAKRDGGGWIETEI